MTMKQVLRALEKSARAANREAEKARREAQRQAIANYNSLVKQQQLTNAVASFNAYQNYVHSIVSYHRAGLERVDWHAVANSHPPPPPIPTNDMEAAALATLQNYKPSLSDRLLGRIDAKRTELEQAVPNARAWDAKMYQDAQTAHAEAYSQWQQGQVLARQIMERDVTVYSAMLEAYRIPSLFEAIGTRITIMAIEPNLVAYSVAACPQNIVPQAELKLSKTGKVSSKEMAKGRYFELLQDHLSSCAIRLACDTFNILCVERVIVNIGEGRVNTATGYGELVTLIGVHFTRDALSRINIYNIDPSDSLANFNVRMKFRKTKGLDPVEPVTPEDAWVTTG